MLSSGPSAPLQPGSTLAQEIAAFAEAFWEVIKKADCSKNTITFHQCCFTFTGRKRTLSAGHPAGESMTVKHFLTCHGIKSQEDLAATLLQLSQNRSDSLHNTVPTRNKDHQLDQPLRKRKPPLPPVLPQPNPADLLSQIDTLRQQLAEERTAKDRFYQLFREERHLRETYEADSFGQQHCAMALDAFIKAQGWKVDTSEIYERGQRKVQEKAREIRNCEQFELYPPLPLPRPDTRDPNPQIPPVSQLKVRPFGPDQGRRPLRRDGPPN